MPKASVIIVTLEGRKHLERLLPGLLAQRDSGIEMEVLVLDNGSSGECRGYVERQFPDARVIELGRNYGFAPAVNRGVKESDGEYVVLLNDDCNVRANWLVELIRPFEANPSIACVGSLILDAAGEKIDFQTGTANIFGWGFQKDRGAEASSARNEPFRTFFACGAACAFRRDVFEAAGMLLEETFAYFEDVEIGWRLNTLGYEVWTNPASVVEHHHGATVKRFGRGFHAFLTERNALLNAWCNLSPDEARVIIPIAMSLSALRFSAKSGMNPYNVLGPEGYGDIFSASAEGLPEPTVFQQLADVGKKVVKGKSLENIASLEAVADFGRLIPRLETRRGMLQQRRKLPTSALLQLMGEPFRPVIGHPREKKYIEEMGAVIRGALR